MLADVMNPDLADLLAAAYEDLIPCDRHDFPFVDRFSQFGVVFETGRPLGGGEMQVRSMMNPQNVAEPWLTLWLRETAGGLRPVTRRSVRSRPWMVEETAELEVSEGRLAVTATHAFADALHLVSSFRLAHAGGAAVKVAPVWRGAVAPDRAPDKNLRDYGLGIAKDRATWAEAAGAVVSGGLRNTSDEVFLPEPALRIEATTGLRAGLVDQSTKEWRSGGRLEPTPGVRAGYGFEADDVVLGPGEAREYVFVTTLRVGTWQDETPAWPPGPDAASVDVAAVVAASRVEFLRWANEAEPAARASGRPERVRRAAWALRRTGYQGIAGRGELGDRVASTCVPVGGSFTHIFFWDALFAAVAAGDFEARLARGAIESVFMRQTEEGYCPEHVFNYWIKPRHRIAAPQAPVAAWAVARHLRRRPEDAGWLGAIWPALEKNFAYWTRLGDHDRDGLAEWTWSGQTADTSPLYDEFKTSRAGCVHLPPVASVQLNSFLYRDALILAGLAERLGKPEAAAAYRADAAAREAALMKWCYVPEERRFWDYNHATQRHRKVRTFYMFWPIWAGMAVPAEAKRDLIENVLLDPAQFFGAVPFPSLAYDEPEFYSGSYTAPDGRAWWRGRAWPQISYWLIEMLVREGYGREADEASRRFLLAYDQEASFPEHLATDPAVYQPSGFPDYNWGVAAYYLLATGAHRDAADARGWQGAVESS